MPIVLEKVRELDQQTIGSIDRMAQVLMETLMDAEKDRMAPIFSYPKENDTVDKGIVMQLTGKCLRRPLAILADSSISAFSYPRERQGDAYIAGRERPRRLCDSIRAGMIRFGPPDDSIRSGMIRFACRVIRFERDLLSLDGGFSWVLGPNGPHGARYDDPPDAQVPPANSRKRT